MPGPMMPVGPQAPSILTPNDMEPHARPAQQLLIVLAMAWLRAPTLPVPALNGTVIG